MRTLSISCLILCHQPERSPPHIYCKRVRHIYASQEVVRAHAASSRDWQEGVRRGRFRYGSHWPWYRRGKGAARDIHDLQERADPGARPARYLRLGLLLQARRCGLVRRRQRVGGCLVVGRRHGRRGDGAADPFAVATCAPLAAIVLWRHRDDVQALRTGVEDKMGE